MSRQTRLGTDATETINLSVTDASIMWTVYGLGGKDNIIGGATNDTIYGDYGEGRYSRTGVADGDYISGGIGLDVIFGEEGNDTLHGDAERDSLVGGQGTDVLYGDNGTDLLRGGTEDDILIGGRDNDRLYGNEGNDRLAGYLPGYGNTENSKDELTGGAGADVFILGDPTSVGYTNNGDYDFAAILDFTRGEDKIQLKASGSFEQSGYSLNYSGNTYGGSQMDQLILYQGSVIGIIVDTPQSVSLTSTYFTAV